MCDVSAGLADYAGLDAEVYGISVDSPFAQAAWAKQSKITVTLLSDLNKTVAAAYGVIFPGLAGIGDTSRPRGLRRRQGRRRQLRRADRHAEGPPQFRGDQGRPRQVTRHP